MSFSRRVFSTWTLTVALLQGKLADATGSRSGSNGVPPACPFSRSPRVNGGHSRHLSLSTPRWALMLVMVLIAARPSKLVMVFDACPRSKNGSHEHHRTTPAVDARPDRQSRMRQNIVNCWSLLGRSRTALRIAR
jgi:hypothetical protein